MILTRKGAKNYKDAVVETKNSQTFIILKGRRQPMVHDPISIFFSNTYEDSFLIPMRNLTAGVIEGKDIPVPPGYYKYQGNIVINKTKLNVNLLLENTDAGKLVPDLWNGEYNLMIK